MRTYIQETNSNVFVNVEYQVFHQGRFVGIVQNTFNGYKAKFFNGHEFEYLGVFSSSLLAEQQIIENS